jgi:isopenicillin N synthase-like dioxygenase
MPKTDFDAIPVISIAALQQGASEAIDGVTAEIAAACEAAGFFYVVDHGVSPARIAAVFEAARWFFGRPPAERNALDVATSPNFRGYVPMGSPARTCRVDCSRRFR